MILIADQQDIVRLPVARIRKLAGLVLSGEGRPGVTLSLAFVDDRAIRAVNRRFLSHDYATDVISFLLEDPQDDLFGEVVVSTQYAAREAGRRRISVAEEVQRYVAHGILHLLGYDDTTTAKKRRMWRRQEDYLGRSQKPAVRSR